jgi:hypothetical protein
MKPEKAARRRARNGRQTKTGEARRVSEAADGPNHPGARAGGSTGLEIAKAPESAAARKSSGDLLDELIPGLCGVTGAKSDDVAGRLVSQAAEARPWDPGASTNEQIITTIRDLAEMTPADPLQARLWAQMMSAHDLAMHFSGKAARQSSIVAAKELALLAKAFMRAFIDQTECWQKLRGAGSQQKVIVEHVHVYPGGQAVVGAIEGAKGAPGGGAGGLR